KQSNSFPALEKIFNRKSTFFSKTQNFRRFVLRFLLLSSSSSSSTASVAYLLLLPSIVDYVGGSLFSLLLFFIVNDWLLAIRFFRLLFLIFS
ncbi:predicted protein, partial [Arabidopsis lyrata subsp. lyrata]